MTHLFKVNFFGKDTLFLELLIKLFREQGIFVCEDINVENYNADIDVHIFESIDDYKITKISKRKQIFIFPTIDFNLLYNVLEHDLILLCDYKTPLNIFSLINFDLLVYKKSFNLAKNRKRYLTSIAFTRKSYKSKVTYTF